MPFDRLAGDEQRLGDLPVRQPLDRERDDAPLARAERVRAAQRRPAHARARDLELGFGTLLQQARAALARELDGLAERATRVGAAPGTAQDHAELEQRATVLEARLGRA